MHEYSMVFAMDTSSRKTWTKEYACISQDMNGFIFQKILDHVPVISMHGKKKQFKQLIQIVSIIIFSQEMKRTFV